MTQSKPKEQKEMNDKPTTHLICFNNHGLQ